MKRKWMALFLALCMALSLCACADSGNDENSANAANAETVTAAKAVSFEATILEVYDGSVMVQPVEGSAELRSADKTPRPLRKSSSPPRLAVIRPAMPVCVPPSRPPRP